MLRKALCLMLGVVEAVARGRIDGVADGDADVAVVVVVEAAAEAVPGQHDVGLVLAEEPHDLAAELRGRADEAVRVAEEDALP